MEKQVVDFIESIWNIKHYLGSRGFIVSKKLKQSRFRHVFKKNKRFGFRALDILVDQGIVRVQKRIFFGEGDSRNMAARYFFSNEVLAHIYSKAAETSTTLRFNFKKFYFTSEKNRSKLKSINYEKDIINRKIKTSGRSKLYTTVQLQISRSTKGKAIYEHTLKNLQPGYWLNYGALLELRSIYIELLNRSLKKHRKGNPRNKVLQNMNIEKLYTLIGSVDGFIETCIREDCIRDMVIEEEIFVFYTPFYSVSRLGGRSFDLNGFQTLPGEVKDVICDLPNYDITGCFVNILNYLFAKYGIPYKIPDLEDLGNYLDLPKPLVKKIIYPYISNTGTLPSYAKSDSFSTIFSFEKRKLLSESALPVSEINSRAHASTCAIIKKWNAENKKLGKMIKLLLKKVKENAIETSYGITYLNEIDFKLFVRKTEVKGEFLMEDMTPNKKYITEKENDGRFFLCNTKFLNKRILAHFIQGIEQAFIFDLVLDRRNSVYFFEHDGVRGLVNYRPRSYGLSIVNKRKETLKTVKEKHSKLIDASV